MKNFALVYFTFRLIATLVLGQIVTALYLNIILHAAVLYTLVYFQLRAQDLVLRLLITKTCRSIKIKYCTVCWK